ncbi:MAG: tRNA (pseudouridine(54)-N(1))-methyltransferase TrmY [Candidatus Jordarchaeales archaeon]
MGFSSASLGFTCWWWAELRRVFVVEARTARPYPDFSLKDLPGSSGRLDVVCRCLVAALRGVGGVRRDTVFWAVLEGGGDPVALMVDGGRVGLLPGSELGVARILGRVFRGESLEGAGFREVVGRVAGEAALFYLHEDGAPLWRVRAPPAVAFVLGDHLGLPRESEELLGGLGAIRVSLGPRRYLGSQCIVIVHYELDRGVASPDAF